MSDYITKKQQVIKQQLAALICTQFRITLKPRRDGLRHENYGNASANVRKKMGNPERFWTSKELVSDSVIRALTIANLKGYDIYITPISSDHHHIVVDDATQASLDELLFARYRPALIQLSSNDNHQVILVVQKADRTDEQSLANKLVLQLNQKYGDQKFSGVVHPFRLAGFYNKKEGREDAVTTVLPADGCGGCICVKATAELELIRSNVSALASPAVTTRGGAAGVSTLPSIIAVEQYAVDAFNRNFRQVEAWTVERSLPVDYSRIDFRVAKNMLAAGYNEQQIVTAMLACSPDLDARHRNAARYAAVTVGSAAKGAKT